MSEQMKNFTDRNNRWAIVAELRNNVNEIFEIASAMKTLGMSQADHVNRCCRNIVDLSDKHHDMANREAEVYQQHIQKMGGVLLDTAIKDDLFRLAEENVRKYNLITEMLADLLKTNPELYQYYVSKRPSECVEMCEQIIEQKRLEDLEDEARI